ncbi:hypothetical protein [Roseiarcus sp.]|uniref:hypothetical protein n=1 Tax=Roseiarcus sp. TaxID=1969460 RepID=UPI003F988BC5
MKAAERLAAAGGRYNRRKIAPVNVRFLQRVLSLDWPATLDVDLFAAGSPQERDAES